jgi:hypothetical protein
MHMQRLTEIALEKAPGGVFSHVEIACWVGESRDRRWSLIKRALAAREIVRIRRGLYCLSSKYLHWKIDPLVVAQRVYGPSYISLETALSYHGWIPEAVFTVTSASLNRSREFGTPLGRFSFSRVPQKTFYAEVVRVEKDDGSFLVASPLKALAEYVYVHGLDWDSARPVFKSLRVEENALAGVEVSSFERLANNYSATRVRRFLEGLRKDVMP